MKYKLLLAFISLMMLSCGSVKPIPIKSQPYSKDFVILNQPYSKEIGNPLIEKSTGYEYESVTITKGSKVLNSRAKIELGNVYYLKATSNEYELYYSPASGIQRGLAIPKAGGRPKHFYAMTEGSLSLEELMEDIEFTKQTTPDGAKDYFKQEFIFSGRSGNEVKFTYREYVNGLARNAFSQDLQYDLSESNIVGFKGLRIEVIKATNTNIEYKVIKSFD